MSDTIEFWYVEHRLFGSNLKEKLEEEPTYEQFEEMVENRSHICWIKRTEVLKKIIPEEGKSSWEIIHIKIQKSTTHPRQRR